MRYDTLDDAHLRLNGTICRWKDDPVFLVPYSGARSVKMLAYRLPNLDGPYKEENESFPINPNDEDLDITTPPLGFCNTLRQGLFYLRRVPFRQQLQGIHPSNLSAVIMSTGNTSPLGDWSNLGYKNIYNMVRREYKTYKEARVSKEDTAFDQVMAVVWRSDVPILAWRGTLVGIMDGDKAHVQSKIVTDELIELAAKHSVEVVAI